MQYYTLDSWFYPRLRYILLEQATAKIDMYI